MADTEKLLEAHSVLLPDTDTVIEPVVLGHSLCETDALWLDESVTLTVEQMVGEVVAEAEEVTESESECEVVPLTLGQDEELTDSLELRVPVLDSVPLSVTVPQAVADCVRLVLGVCEPEALWQPEGVVEAQLLADTDGLVEELTVPLREPLTVPLKLAVEHSDAEADTLALEERVPLTVKQPLLVSEGELDEDSLELKEGLFVTLTVTLFEPHAVTEAHCDEECEELALGDRVPETLAHPEAVADEQLLADKDTDDEGDGESVVERDVV